MQHCRIDQSGHEEQGGVVAEEHGEGVEDDGEAGAEEEGGKLSSA